MQEKIYQMSVRELAAFVFQSGDLSASGGGTRRMEEGRRLHQRRQKDYGELRLTPEVVLRREEPCEGFTLVLEGRADGAGVLDSEDGRRLGLIEEIKTTLFELSQLGPESYPVYRAQAMLYGAMLAMAEDLTSVRVDLTFVQVETEDIRTFSTEATREELDAFFQKTMDVWKIWVKKTHLWETARDQRLRALPFPFSAYRPGQRELAAAVFRNIRDKQLLLAQAPTGIGKTLAVLYPALKALGEGHCRKVFYLTARTTQADIAMDALKRMDAGEGVVRVVRITAKDKICMLEERDCSPAACPWAAGYYDRIRPALDELLQLPEIVPERLRAMAEKHMVCPYEMSLDAALWCDCLVMDYNYAMDPGAYLRRFFDEGGDFAMLTDEAHNLPDRAREMFSAGLEKESFLALRRKIGMEEPGLRQELSKISKAFLELKKASKNENEATLSEALPEVLKQPLRRWMERVELWMEKGLHPSWRSEMSELTRLVFAFLRCMEFYGPEHRTMTESLGQNVRVRLLCLDPARLLAQARRKAASWVWFSATLQPDSYYRSLLAFEADPLSVRIRSPFPPGNLLLMADTQVSTRWQDRERTALHVAGMILAAVQNHGGHVMAFFPSFQYLKMIHGLMQPMAPYLNMQMQTSGMSVEERGVFLDAFREPDGQPLLGLAVMGGVFGEGIDLTGNRLEGVIIVGPGLPTVDREREAMRQWYETEYQAGFDYAYRFPGMNRVIQAAGRVIRTREDRGFVLLLDQRFGQSGYRELFPAHWPQPRRVRNPEELRKCIAGWKNTEEEHQ